VPITRYFVVVGIALTVLLLIAGWSLPESPASFPDRPEIIDRTIIRIKSAHKWPEKVVLDTSQPTTASAAVEEPPTAQSVWLPSEAGNQSKLEAMAQLKADTQPGAVDRTLQVKRGVARTARSRRHNTRQLVRAEQGAACCQFGRVDNRQTFSNATPHRDVALSWPMVWPAFTGRN
jgi:hypothetical protein